MEYYIFTLWIAIMMFFTYKLVEAHMSLNKVLNKIEKFDNRSIGKQK